MVDVTPDMFRLWVKSDVSPSVAGVRPIEPKGQVGLFFPAKLKRDSERFPGLDEIIRKPHYDVGKILGLVVQTVERVGQPLLLNLLNM